VNMWTNQWAPHGPINERHVAPPKRPITTRERISKIKNCLGPPNLVNHANFSKKLEGILETSLNLVGVKYISYIYIYIYIYNIYIYIYITNIPKTVSVGFDPGTSVDAQALANLPTNTTSWVSLGISTQDYYLKFAICPAVGERCGPYDHASTNFKAVQSSL
jgi:hypothetical protein